MSSVRISQALCGAVCTLACVVSQARPAHAESESWHPGDRVTSRVKGEVRPHDEPSTGDGVYGRFDGDLWLTLGAGAELSHGVRPAVQARALYYHTAGLSLGYADAFDGSAFVRRDGWLNVELRPLFLVRWALDLEFQKPLLDLTLDSLALGAGMFVAERGGGGTTTGVELSAGFGVPLFAKAQGLWLEARGFLRPTLSDASRGVLLSLSYYAPLVTPLVK
jgi:hypothetical protein